MLDVQESAREKREGMGRGGGGKGGEREGKGRVVDGSKRNTKRVRSEWRGAYSPGFALPRASSRSRWSSSFLVCWGRANVLSFMTMATPIHIKTAFACLRI